jgi:non-ribosomal peptide synthetase component F
VVQAESVRLERVWKSKAAEEREFVLDSRDKEEKESARRHRQLNEETAEVMALHEQMAQDVRRAQDGLATVSAELEDTRREIDVYVPCLLACFLASFLYPPPFISCCFMSLFV